MCAAPAARAEPGTSWRPEGSEPRVHLDAWEIPWIEESGGLQSTAGCSPRRAAVHGVTKLDATEPAEPRESTE